MFLIRESMCLINAIVCMCECKCDSEFSDTGAGFSLEDDRLVTEFCNYYLNIVYVDHG